jgi:hypothetical protein
MANVTITGARNERPVDLIVRFNIYRHYSGQIDNDIIYSNLSRLTEYLRQQTKDNEK